MIEKLSDTERTQLARDLPKWRHEPVRDAIIGLFKFPSFKSAMAFMQEVAVAADELDHHPEWSNVYDRVDVLLTTHDADGLSTRDVALAHLVTRIAALHGGTFRD